MKFFENIFHICLFLLVHFDWLFLCFGFENQSGQVKPFSQSALQLFSHEYVKAKFPPLFHKQRRNLHFVFFCYCPEHSELQFGTYLLTREGVPLSSTHQAKIALWCLELRGFLCGTEGFLMWNWGGWNWGVFGVELRGFWCGTEEFWGWKGVALLCGIDVLNWGGCGTEGDPSYTVLKINCQEAKFSIKSKFVKFPDSF